MTVSMPIMDGILTRFTSLEGSDLYLTVGLPPTVRVSDRLIGIEEAAITDDSMQAMLEELLSEAQMEEVEAIMDFNMPLQWHQKSRFRINIYRQQQHYAMVIRRIQTNIPTPESLGLPAAYSEIIMERRGLVLVVGPTGSGKTSSLAAMIGHRNEHGYGHIVTIEDPIEFVHEHKGCIITQRDVGADTFSFGTALKNVLRQRPDVVLIGELRDRETMEHALHFSETGHLCVATLHAGNSYQAIEHMLHFFPEERHTQTLHSLAYNLRGILSQRLMLAKGGNRMLAVEVMLNRGHIRNLIRENKIKEISDIVAKNTGEGMQTMDQAIFKLFRDQKITEETATAEAENPANVKLLIRQLQNTARTASMKSTPPPGIRTRSISEF